MIRGAAAACDTHLGVVRRRCVSGMTEHDGGGTIAYERAVEHAVRRADHGRAQHVLDRQLHGLVCPRVVGGISVILHGNEGKLFACGPETRHVLLDGKCVQACRGGARHPVYIGVK